MWATIKVYTVLLHRYCNSGSICWSPLSCVLSWEYISTGYWARHLLLLFCFLFTLFNNDLCNLHIHIFNNLNNMFLICKLSNKRDCFLLKISIFLFSICQNTQSIISKRITKFSPTLLCNCLKNYWKNLKRSHGRRQAFSHLKVIANS